MDLNKLGNIVANREKLPIHEVITNYETHLKPALAKSPTPSKHVNVLRRMYGHLYKKLPKCKQQMIEQRISEYQDREVSLSDTLRYLIILTSDINRTYLAKQSYSLLFLDKNSTWEEF